MLSLGFLLQTSQQWVGSKLRIQTIVNAEPEKEHALNRLRALIVRGRINAEPGVVLRGDRSPFAVIQEASAKADLTLVGLRPPDRDETVADYAAYYTRLLEQTAEFGSTAYVLAAEDIDFVRIFE